LLLIFKNIDSSNVLLLPLVSFIRFISVMLPGDNHEHPDILRLLDGLGADGEADILRREELSEELGQEGDFQGGEGIGGRCAKQDLSPGVGGEIAMEILRQIVPDVCCPVFAGGNAGEEFVLADDLRVEQIVQIFMFDIRCAGQDAVDGFLYFAETLVTLDGPLLPGVTHPLGPVLMRKAMLIDFPFFRRKGILREVTP